MRLKEKVILVTGSTTGIGEAMARTFAREGARVMVHGIDEAAARNLVDDIRRREGQAHHVTARLEDPSAAPRVIQSVVAQ